MCEPVQWAPALRLLFSFKFAMLLFPSPPFLTEPRWSRWSRFALLATCVASVEVPGMVRGGVACVRAGKERGLRTDPEPRTPVA